MKIKPEYKLRKIGGTNIVVSTAGMDFQGIITVNDTAEFIWRKLENGMEENEIISIEKKIEQIYADKIEGIIKIEDFTKFYDSYQQKKEKLNVKLKGLKKELAELDNDKIIDYRKIKKLAEECLNMEELEPALLEKLIDRI